MSDEFDDLALPPPPARGRSASASSEEALAPLVSQVYAACDPPRRARLLQRLLDPLGTLALAAIAAGAFAGFLGRRGADGIRVSLDDVGRFSGEQVAELARFVAQVSPESLQSLAGALVDNPIGLSAVGASAVVLLARLMRRRAPDGAAEAVASPPVPDRPPR